MILLVVAMACLLCAVGPAVLFFVNLRRYRAPEAAVGELPGISVLIPARNEAHGIEAAVRSVLASRGMEFEVIVMDDASTDGTGEKVLGLTGEDARVRLEVAPALPAGWNGKQHACWQLAQRARYPVMCFLDADVRLEPEALARTAGFLESRQVSLVSGFPRQVTGTVMEWMLLPLIHFVLLGFLPMGRMRGTTDPACAAGCGQFMMVRREDYFACGGHSGIKPTMHDGLRLPRLFREHGLGTDLADITDLARCRMYTSAGQVWQGLAKNATEGIGAPARIVPVSVLLVLGQVLPFVLPVVLKQASPLVGMCLLVAAMVAWMPRLAAIGRFRQDWRGAVLHPVGMVLLLAIQWYALGRQVMGRAVSWKDRAYTGD